MTLPREVETEDIAVRLKAQQWIHETLTRRSILHWDKGTIRLIKKLINQEYQKMKALEFALFNHKRARGKLLAILTKEQRDDNRNRGNAKFVRD